MVCDDCWEFVDKPSDTFVIGGGSEEGGFNGVNSSITRNHPKFWRNFGLEDDPSTVNGTQHPLN
jgi:hypothetical protein